ncbi:MAG: hypothetical protein AAFV80_23480 [Bacteroidota bacterium]
MYLNNWKRLALDFLSIFIAVISAFALNNWNENRRDSEAASKILAEISNGLEKDLEDITINMFGHKAGIRSCQYWRDIFNGEIRPTDSLGMHYSTITRDFISIQNVSGYESLKSKGLELIEDDSLRFEIIALYEYDYQVLKKFEEEYHEMQFQENFFDVLNQHIAPHLEYDQKGNIVQLKVPFRLPEGEKKLLMSYLWKIQMNRSFILQYYGMTEEKVKQLRQRIQQAI